MALAIATNTGALMAAASATSVNKDMETSMERLSTGKRINSAKDDAAGVAIASRLSSEIRGTNQAIRNAQDGQALINTAEGAHKEIENILQRMRELAVQAANDTNDGIDRGNLQAEISALTTEIDRIAEATTWAGQKLLTGVGGNNGDGTFAMQVGGRTSAENQITATVNAMTTAALGIGEGGVSVSADAATMTEVGNNALQLSGTPAAGDVFNLTVGGTDLAVKLMSVADEPSVLVPSGIQTNDTEVTFSDNTLTVTATGAGGADFFNITVNGTDIQVTAATSNTAAQNATAIKTAIDAVSDLGVSVTDNSDGTLTFAPTTEYQVSTDGGTTYGSTASFAANGVEGAAGAITAAINGQTSTDFVGLTATAGTDGSITVTQAINFSAASESAETNAAATNTAGDVLTIDASGVTSGGTTTFDINGETIAVTIAGDEYTDDINGLKAQLEEEIASNTKLGGLGLTVAINGTNLEITAAAETTDLIKDVSTDAASATAATTGLSVDSAGNARSAIEAIDVAIQSVNTQRANLGAISNRLDNTVSNLTNVMINLEGGKGRIEDADFAAESTSLAKSQILQQASTAMLAQANASKQNVLSLLQG